MESNLGRITFNMRGEWVTTPETPYLRLDVVSLNGSSYAARANNVVSNPTTSSTDWQKIAERGDLPLIVNETIIPTSVPEGTGIACWFTIAPGTYTNFGGHIVSVNSIALFVREADNSFSCSQMPLSFDLSEYAKLNLLSFKADLVIGKNIFNKDTIFIDKYLTDDGGLGNYGGHYLSDYIAVESLQNYVSNFAFRFFTFFNSDKQVILGGGSNIQNFSTTADAKFVRVTYTIPLESIYSVQIEKGSVQTSFEAYRFKIPSNQIEFPASGSYVNTITAPKKQHFLTTIENNIYFEEFQKRVLPNYLLNTSVPIGYLRNNRITATNPIAGTYPVVNSLTDLNYNDIVIRNYDIVVTNLSKTTPIKVLSIGDSYTDIGWYVKKMGQTIPNVTHLGTCNYQTIPDDVNREGRSGWDLNKYMNQNGSTAGDGVFSPFIHPTAPYKYYGNTAFWAKVYANVAPQYEIGFLSHQIGLLNINASGVRVTPNVNDTMYFTADATFKFWTGTVWQNILESELGFTFNFTKYLETWNIDTPDIVTVLLGMNDFRNLNPNLVATFFIGWKANMDAFIANLKLANPDVKIIICTTNSVEYNDYCGKTNAALWESYNQIINTYDNREGDNIFISDTKASADRVYGFGAVRSTPFEQYIGSETILLTSGDVHLREGGMHQIGQKLAATIQYARD